MSKSNEWETVLGLKPPPNAKGGASKKRGPGRTRAARNPNLVPAAYTYPVPATAAGADILINQAVTSGDLLQLLGISRHVLSKMVDQGYLLPLGRGVFDFRAAIQGYIRYLQAPLNATGSGTPDGENRRLTYQEERTKKIAAQARLAEMEADEREGVLINKEVEYARATKAMVLVRTRMLNVASRVALRLVGLTEERAIKEIITGEIREGLQELAHPDAMVGQEFELSYEQEGERLNEALEKLEEYDEEEAPEEEGHYLEELEDTLERALGIKPE